MKVMLTKQYRKITSFTLLLRMLKTSHQNHNVRYINEITQIVKLPIPDKKFEIKDENIPNLRKLLSKSKPKENG